MPIEPIDLQVLFSKMTDVGKDQAVASQATQLAQTVQAGDLVRRTEQQSHSVNEAKESSEIEHIGERSGGSGGKAGRRKGRPKAENEAERDAFSDPELGKNIDISG